MGGAWVGNGAASMTGDWTLVAWAIKARSILVRVRRFKCAIASSASTSYAGSFKVMTFAGKVEAINIIV